MQFLIFYVDKRLSGKGARFMGPIKGDYVIKQGNVAHKITMAEHRNNLYRFAGRFPKMLHEIPALSARFEEKPQFVIQENGNHITVLREDYMDKLNALIHRDEDSYFRRLSQSEWRALKTFSYDDAPELPITMHDVYEDNGITIKTGNPTRNNSYEEFYRALFARCQGLVEAKSPLGFSFWIDDIYGAAKPGKMFYKNLNGEDLDMAQSRGNTALSNWALWEAGKFLSRLMYANLYLDDSNRLSNFFIEQKSGVPVFRFLDLERLSFYRIYSSIKKIEMLSKFINAAMKKGLLTDERLGEFIIVCLGPHFDLAPQLREALK